MELLNVMLAFALSTNSAFAAYNLDQMWWLRCLLLRRDVMAVHHGQRGTSTRNWTTESNWSMAQQSAMFPCCSAPGFVVYVVCYRSESEGVNSHSVRLSLSRKSSPFTLHNTNAGSKPEAIFSRLCLVAWSYTLAFVLGLRPGAGSVARGCR